MRILNKKVIAGTLAATIIAGTSLLSVPKAEAFNLGKALAITGAAAIIGAIDKTSSTLNHLNPIIKYFNPKISRNTRQQMLKEVEGELVKCDVEYDSKGNVKNVKLIRGTSIKEVNDAVIKQLYDADITPAKNHFGKTAPGTYHYRYVFTSEKPNKKPHRLVPVYYSLI